MEQILIAPRRCGDGQRGIALVAVLWVFILLSLMAASIAATSRTDARIARNVVAAAVAEAAADAAVHLAAVALVAQQGRSGDWRTDGTPRTVHVGTSDVAVAVQDEGGKVDLNGAPRPLLDELMRHLGETDSPLPAVIQDWRDADDFVTPGGAEDRDYARAGYPYGAKDAPFDSVDELLQVMGVTPHLFVRLAPLVTVYSNSRGIDASVAPRDVLLALAGMDPATVDLILNERERAAGTGTAPSSATPRFSMPSPRNVFTVTATARSGDGGVFVREAVVHLPRASQRPYVFLAWRQGRLSEANRVAGAP